MFVSHRKPEIGKSTIHLGREGFTMLIRRPLVQGLLAFTVMGQVAAAHASPPGKDPGLLGTPVQRETAAKSPVVRLAPVTAGVDARASSRGSAKAADVEQIAASYRAQGFPVTQRLASQIGAAAARYAIDPAVAFGLVRAESSFRNTATSTVGAVGLTQLMPKTAAWMEPGITRNELRDPETNLRVGFKYLRYLIDRYEGDESLALTAYNRGPGTVDKALDRGRNPDNGYAAFVRGEANHGHTLFTR
jgi:soluble lytic murein transglycosylase-like protein